MDDELLSLLLACKAQIEEDAVHIDRVVGWAQPLGAMIDQGRMPKAWDALVAFLQERGHA